MVRHRGELRGRVVVITGASSGIGREAAVELARRGCSVVVAARRDEDLEVTARLCRDTGADALAVVTDVTREGDVQALADTAIARFGQIDVWINGAGVTSFGLLDETPMAEHWRVIETNLFGAIYGARAVMPHFRERKRGTLIETGSVLDEIGQAFVPSYVISKFGARGLSEALRVEVADEPDIHVCTVAPYAVDTPHFQTGASFVGKRAHAMPSVQSPEKVARVSADVALRPRREVHVPHIAALGLALHRGFPTTTERLLLRALETWHFDDVPERESSGNLFRPLEVNEARVHGARRPLIGTAGFVLWVVRELFSMAGEATRRRLRELAPWSTPWATS